MPDEYLRIDVEHDDGIEAVYLVRRITINEPVAIQTGVGGSIRILSPELLRTEKRIPVGTSVRFKHQVDRYPHFTAPKDMTGIVVDLGDPEMVAVKMDSVIPGAEYWNNEVHWYLQNGDDPIYDLEVL